jgi:hypothetical protein
MPKNIFKKRDIFIPLPIDVIERDHIYNVIDWVIIEEDMGDGQ